MRYELVNNSLEDLIVNEFILKNNTPNFKFMPLHWSLSDKIKKVKENI